MLAAAMTEGFSAVEGYVCIGETGQTGACSLVAAGGAGWRAEERTGSKCGADKDPRRTTMARRCRAKRRDPREDTAPVVRMDRVGQKRVGAASFLVVHDRRLVAERATAGRGQQAQHGSNAMQES